MQTKQHRTPTCDVTLDTWTVRVDGRDEVDVELDVAQVCAVRDLVAAATGGRVSLGRTANMRGILLDMIGESTTNTRSAR